MCAFVLHFKLSETICFNLLQSTTAPAELEYQFVHSERQLLGNAVYFKVGFDSNTLYIHINLSLILCIECKLEINIIHHIRFYLAGFVACFVRRREEIVMEL